MAGLQRALEGVYVQRIGSEHMAVLKQQLAEQHTALLEQQQAAQEATAAAAQAQQEAAVKLGEEEASEGPSPNSSPLALKAFHRALRALSLAAPQQDGDYEGGQQGRQQQQNQATSTTAIQSAATVAATTTGPGQAQPASCSAQTGSPNSLLRPKVNKHSQPCASPGLRVRRRRGRGQGVGRAAAGNRRPGLGMRMLHAAAADVAPLSQPGSAGALGGNENREERETLLGGGVSRQGAGKASNADTDGSPANAASSDSHSESDAGMGDHSHPPNPKDAATQAQRVQLPATFLRQQQHKGAPIARLLQQQQQKDEEEEEERDTGLHTAAPRPQAHIPHITISQPAAPIAATLGSAPQAIISVVGKLSAAPILTQAPSSTGGDTVDASPPGHSAHHAALIRQALRQDIAPSPATSVTSVGEGPSWRPPANLRPSSPAPAQAQAQARLSFSVGPGGDTGAHRLRKAALDVADATSGNESELPDALAAVMARLAGAGSRPGRPLRSKGKGGSKGDLLGSGRAGHEVRVREGSSTEGDSEGDTTPRPAVCRDQCSPLFARHPGSHRIGGARIGQAGVVAGDVSEAENADAAGGRNTGVAPAGAPVVGMSGARGQQLASHQPALWGSVNRGWFDGGDTETDGGEPAARGALFACLTAGAGVGADSNSSDQESAACQEPPWTHPALAAMHRDGLHAAGQGAKLGKGTPSPLLGRVHRDAGGDAGEGSDDGSNSDDGSECKPLKASSLRQARQSGSVSCRKQRASMLAVCAQGDTLLAQAKALAAGLGTSWGGMGAAGKKATPRKGGTAGSLGSMGAGAGKVKHGRSILSPAGAATSSGAVHHNRRQPSGTPVAKAAATPGSARSRGTPTRSSAPNAHAALGAGGLGYQRASGTPTAAAQRAAYKDLKQPR